MADPRCPKTANERTNGRLNGAILDRREWAMKLHTVSSRTRFRWVVALGLLLSAFGVEEGIDADDLVPTPTSYESLLPGAWANSSWIVTGQAGRYDYAPSAIMVGLPSTDSRWRVAHCGQDEVLGAAGDSVYLTPFTAGGELLEPWPGGGTGPRAILRFTFTDSREDGRHICAPSIFRHAHAAINGGYEYYKMYYECARKYYDRTSGQVAEGPTQICHAVSTDGFSWTKFNRAVWDATYTYGEGSGPTTVVRIPGSCSSNSECPSPVPGCDIPHGRCVCTTDAHCGWGSTCNQTINRCSVPVWNPPNCNYAIESGKHKIKNATCLPQGEAPLNYGVGHPSVVVMKHPTGQQIWLWYYDGAHRPASATDPEDLGSNRVYLRKSWDGFNFEAPLDTNLQENVDVKFYPNTAAPAGYFENGGGVFIALSNFGGENFFRTSTDGEHWSDRTPMTQALNIGCSQPRTASEDAGNCEQGATAAMVSSKYGQLDTWSAIPILSAEGQAASTTWDIYNLWGAFHPTP